MYDIIMMHHAIAVICWIYEGSDRMCLSCVWIGTFMTFPVMQHGA